MAAAVFIIVINYRFGCKSLSSVLFGWVVVGCWCVVAFGLVRTQGRVVLLVPFVTSSTCCSALMPRVATAFAWSWCVLGLGAAEVSVVSPFKCTAERIQKDQSR